jgi:hypothetical protein
MEYKIERGDTYKCIKTFKMETGEKAYIKGKEYFSEVDRCITDEETDCYHNMEDIEDFFDYFKFLPRKR